MKPSFEIVNTGGTSSIKVKTYIKGSLNVPLHYHPEHELVLVQSGSGKLIVADATISFTKGDFLFIGSNVPHLYLDADKKTLKKIKVLVVQFKENLFENLSHIPEFYHTGKFLTKMKQGIKVSRLPELETLVTGLIYKKGIARFNMLSYLLDRIERSGKYVVITRSIRKTHTDELSSTRLKEVYAILQNNYTRDITIDEVAKTLHLSKTSFCRFLKKETGKTFTGLLNKERIQYACALLRETSYTVKQVSYQAGFNNPSYFYRQFNKLEKISPTKYKEKYLSIKWSRIKNVK